MSERQVSYRFDELIEQGILEIGDGYRAKLEELGGSGPIFLRAGLLTEHNIDWTKADKFRNELIPKVRSKLGYPGDTVVTTKGNSVGRTAYIPLDSPLFVYSPHLSYWRSVDSSRLASGFLRYWSQSGEFTNQLNAMANSTDMAPYLSLIDQRRLRISLPEISMQNAAAAVLEALDNKIYSNEKLISCIGKLLKVNFTGAMRSANRETELREIVDLRYGKALKETERTPGSIPVYGSNGISGWHDAPLVRGPGIIVGRKGANAGSISWSQTSFWAIDTAFYVEPKSGDISREFILFLLDSVGLRGLVGDSAIPGLNREIALSCEVLLPSAEIIGHFTAKAAALLSLKEHMSGESSTLTNLRDTLLPKLMSGKIRVRDAEKAVEEAT